MSGAIRHPYTGSRTRASAMLVKVTAEDGRSGLFRGDGDGRWRSTRRRPQMCGWIAGPRIANTASGRRPHDGRWQEPFQVGPLTLTTGW